MINVSQTLHCLLLTRLVDQVLMLGISNHMNGVWCARNMAVYSELNGDIDRTAARGIQAYKNPMFLVEDVLKGGRDCGT